jgi:hypothetical protein
MRKRTFFSDSSYGVFVKKRQIHSSLSVDYARFAALDILNQMNADILPDMNNSGLISAYKGWSLFSDTLIITISITRSDSGQGCDLVVQSESANPTPLWDGGVNNRNLNKFEKLFRTIDHNSVQLK